MKPDWDKLMDEFKDSQTALVADVDCTTEGKDLCETHGIRGFPTIKYGEPSDMKDYDGGRSFADFKKFAEENLGPTCGPANIDLCSDDNKAVIDKFQKMDEDELDAAIEAVENNTAKISGTAQKAVEKLNQKIKDLEHFLILETVKKDDMVAKENKKTGLRMMKAVAAAKKKKEAGGSKKRRKGKKEL